jgi:hypothetical protein
MSFIHKYILDTYKNLPIHGSNCNLRFLLHCYEYTPTYGEADCVGFGGSGDDSASIIGSVLRLSHLNKHSLNVTRYFFHLYYWTSVF